MPLHILEALPLQEKLLNGLKRCVQDILWGFDTYKEEWVSWYNICQPVPKGGLGVHL